MQGGLTPKALTCVWRECDWSCFASLLPPTREKRGWGSAPRPEIYSSAPYPPCPHFFHQRLLLKTFWSQKNSCYLLWLNSGPMGAWQGYGSLLPPPESRLAFPGSWELAGTSADIRLPYDWCCSRSGTSWTGVTGYIPWHDGLDLNNCSTSLPLICVSAYSLLWVAFHSQLRTPHQGWWLGQRPGPRLTSWRWTPQPHPPSSSRSPGAWPLHGWVMDRKPNAKHTLKHW